MVSATIKRQPHDAEREAQADEDRRQRPGKDHPAEQFAVGHAVDASHLDQLRIDGADAVQRVEVDREEHAERDQEQLCRLVDPEPQDDQRDQRQMRDVAHHLQRRIGQLAGRAATGHWRARTTKPMLPPIRKPTLARQKLTQMLRASSPDSSSFQPASATSLGAGSTRAETKPVTQASLPDQDDRERHDPRDQAVDPRQSGCADARKTVDETHDCDACFVRPVFVGDGLAERPGVDADRRDVAGLVRATAAGTPARRSDRLPPGAGSRT